MTGRLYRAAVAAILVGATVGAQPAPTGWDAVLAGYRASGDQNGFISHLYLHRPSRTGWVISMNTDTTRSKDGTRPSSRDVDMTVRKLIVDHLIK